MGRPRKVDEPALVHRALDWFWQHGYTDSSMDDLVRATGSSRHGIYAHHGSKRALFLAALQVYDEIVVTPAFRIVEQGDADLGSIARFFEHQIARAAAEGLPGRGCLIANTMTENAPHDAEIRAHIHAHQQRLRTGFRRVLRHSATASIGAREIDDLADMLVVATQGLWSYSRSVESAAPLRRYAKTLLALIEHRMTP